MNQIHDPTIKKLDIHFSKRRLCVVGLNKNIAENDLVLYFSKYGGVQDISYELGQPFGFITFEYFTKFPGLNHILKGEKIKVRIMSPYNDPMLNTTKVRAHGIFNQLSAADLIDYFSQFGPVESVLKIHGAKICRSAIIQFKKTESVEVAVKVALHLINGHLVDIRKAR